MGPSISFSLEQSIPSIIVRVLDRSESAVAARVDIDDSSVAGELRGRPIEVDPGERRIRVTSSDGRKVEHAVVVEEGVRHRVVEFRLPSIAAPPGADSSGPASTRAVTGPLILGGLGLASLATFTVIALSTDADYRSLQSQCGSRCGPAEVDDRKSSYRVADVFLVTGIGALVGAGLWWLLSASPAPTPSSR